MTEGDYIITFVRHGETASNLRGAFLGVTDDPLNSRGETQAHATGRFLQAKKFQFDYAFTSPLKRCTETAVILRQYLDIDPVVEPLLRERHYGLFEGKSRTELNAQVPELLKVYQRDKPFVKLAGGESAIDVEKRVKELFWTKIPRLYPNGGSMLIITHLNPLRAFLRLAGLRDWEVYFQPFQNASVTQIQTDWQTFKLLIDNYTCLGDPTCDPFPPSPLR